MTNIKDGANYAPTGAAKRVVAEGEFGIAAAFLDHGHIYGQVNGLRDAGATLRYVYDPDPDRLAAFCERYPEVKAVDSFEAILQAQDIHLVCAAAIPSERADIGIDVLRAGKHYFTDKAPFTTLEQLVRAKQCVADTGLRYWVYYAERIHNDAAWRAGELVASGAIGRVLQVLNIAPHRLNPGSRPEWFFKKSRYGGILTDIGSHQVEQFLTYANATDAQVNFARVENFNNPGYPELEDFGEFSMTADNGASFYSRVDWYTPDGLRTWGDGRTFILGTEGSIELRKYIDITGAAPSSTLLLVDAAGEHREECLGQTGFPFFGQLILDCINGTELAMTQNHTFKAAELSLRAQQVAEQSASKLGD